MQQEFETQIVDVNKEEIITKLRGLGAKEDAELLQKRWVFDMSPCTVDSKGEWIRLRQVGNKKPTLTYKNKAGSGLNETTELEVTVDDFEKTALILSQVKGFTGKYYQENKRIKFEYKGIEFTLDTWPMIPTYLEIEGRSEADVHKGLTLLGLEGKDQGHLGTVAIYHRYGIELHDIAELKF